jgi:hypothetical protein
MEAALIDPFPFSASQEVARENQKESSVELKPHGFFMIRAGLGRGRGTTGAGWLDGLSPMTRACPQNHDLVRDGAGVVSALEPEESRGLADKQLFRKKDS